ncbi:transcription factor UNE10-like, partial [Thalictrum thalictroides]
MSSQCVVPNWDLDENPTSVKLPFHPNSNMNDAKVSDVIDPTTLDYEVAELTWENGQLALHGLGPPRIIGGSKPVSSKYTWEKPRASGTLESIVHQAVQLGPCGAPICHDELVPWLFDHQQRAIGTAGTMTMDAMVPASSNSSHFVNNSANQITDPNHRRVPRKSTRVESSGGTTSFERGKEREERTVRKRTRVPRAVMTRERCSRNQSVSISDTFGRDSRQVGADSCDMDLDMGFTSTSLDSDTNLNTLDDRDSVSHTRPQKQARIEEDNKSTQNDKSTISTKRSRAAAIHNQSERKRRDKINQRMKTLQKLVPNSSK